MPTDLPTDRRSVDDLLAALVSLEERAPDVEALLTRGPAPVRQPGRSSVRWAVPAAAVAVVIAAVVAVGGLAAPASHHDRPGGPAGSGRLLPFRLARALPQLSLLDVRNDTRSARPFGAAVLAEYGSEVTILVWAIGDDSRHWVSGTRTTVNGAAAWIDTRCSVLPAPSSAATNFDPPSRPGVPPYDSTCALTFDKGPWRVAVYVAGPGGGSRRITAQQFREIGDRLQLAASPADPATWFPANELLPG